MSKHHVEDFKTFALILVVFATIVALVIGVTMLPVAGQTCVMLLLSAWIVFDLIRSAWPRKMRRQRLR
jgi:hypothetical protein